MWLRTHVALALIAWTGCGEPKLARQALPELEQPRAASDAELARRLDLRPGEELVWDIRWRGVLAGKLTMATGVDSTVRSSFRAVGLAAHVGKLGFSLATVVDGQRPVRSRERFRDATGSRVTDALFDGARYRIAQTGGQVRRAPEDRPVQTLQTALAAVRAWAAPDAAPGTMLVLHGRELYRLEVTAPILERRTGRMRIACRAVPIGSAAGVPDVETNVTIWLSTDARRAPVRIEVEQEGDTAVAELHVAR